MAQVNTLNISLLENPAPFDAPLQFEITFHLIARLEEDLEWRLVYVGSADSDSYDQLLDVVSVGPIKVGYNKFVFVAPAPDIKKIPEKDVIGATILMLVASYRKQDFFKIGYFVNNEYASSEKTALIPQNITRNVLLKNPRVTKYEINWE